MTPTQLISLASVAVLIFWAVGAYNRLVRLRNAIANAFGHVDLQLKRRYELIPKLVEATEKHPRHDRASLEALTNARNQAKNASDAARSRPADALTVTTLAAAEHTLTSSLGSLLAWNDADPELKADPSLRELSEELASTDTQVTFARQAFNDAVLNYNQAQGQFPAVLIARSFSFATAALWQATESADQRTDSRIQTQ
jgi:LemA protein